MLKVGNIKVVEVTVLLPRMVEVDIVVVVVRTVGRGTVECDSSDCNSSGILKKNIIVTSNYCWYC